jgi:hypothetical protein
MKSILKQILTAKSSLGNGLLALFIISLIALGCTCNQFGKKEGNSNSSTREKKEEGNPFDTPDGTAETPVEKKEIVKADASKKEIPSDEELQEIVKETLMNFNDAIERGDFSDFHKTISKAWQRQTKPKTFEDGFRQFIDKKVDISQIRSQKATFSPAPKVGREKTLQGLIVKGTYPTSPTPTEFELIYTAEGKEWKLSAINVRTRSFRSKFQN